MDPAEEALAHCQITSLLSRYYQSIDQADLEALGRDVLAEEAVWEVTQSSPTEGSIKDVVEGRPAVLEWFGKILGGGVAMGEGTCRHFLSTHVIEVDGDSATSTSHLQAVHTHTLQPLANGVVRARHTRTPGGWRIAHLRLVEDITDADMVGFKAAVPRAE
jgi:ketosteroid isomerase-like protein